MQDEVAGSVAQAAKLSFERGDTLWASRGSLIAHTADLSWDIQVPGGLSAGLKRSLSGSGIALMHVRSRAPGQSVTIGANAPGHLAKWELATHGPVLTTRGAFLAAWGSDINITVSIVRKVGAALFGGTGLVLQRVEGDGIVLIHGGGDFRRVDLAKNEDLLVSTGNLAAFSDSMSYDIRRVGSIRKSLFGKEGLFMTRLTGPGVVLLQTLKPDGRPRGRSGQGAT